MSEIDKARKIAEEWAKQNKKFDGKHFRDDATRKAAEAEYKKAQDHLRKR